MRLALLYFRVAKCTGTSCEGSSSDDAGCLGENLVTNSPSYRHAPAQALASLRHKIISFSDLIN